ncbi:MAG: BadF/BadG/BcrA/BcrD ATPase family protein [Eubacteriales bacterium]|nr:BadF/BadG/BcrA/BcrD ATPase family protein [Eubacteriales bacterium]
MKYFIGIDGGGTKTELALSTEDGIPFETRMAKGSSYQSIGVEAVVRLLRENTKILLERAGITFADCAGCCIGLPCYGENPEIDSYITTLLEKAFAPVKVHIVNDVEVGWAGSLECREGIHVVSGTGSIAFGSGIAGQSARCGGWDEFYGDEGSCYWVGRQAMSLFSKEADGRAPKGALYDIVRKECGILRDFYFTHVIRESYAPYREKVAAFQNYACRAAGAGDEAARALYEAAAKELACMVKAIRKQIIFSEEIVDVSYSGGIFKTGDLILGPFRKEVEALGCSLKKPCRTTTEGALLLAMKYFST